MRSNSERLLNEQSWHVPKPKSPAAWLPVVYFMQGLPFAIISLLVAMMYKSFMLPNASIALYTSLLLLPWSLKPLWSPWLESLACARTLTLLSQLFMALLFLMLSVSFFISANTVINFIVFFLIAFLGATYDIVSDSLYMRTLTMQEQVLYVGYRTLFYQLARIFSQGGLAYLASFLMLSVSVTQGWQLTYLTVSFLIFGCVIYNFFAIPKVNFSAGDIKNHNVFVEVIKDYLKMPSILYFITFILIYNFSEAQLIRVAPLFFMDSKAHGGLDMQMANTGFSLGVIGIVAMMIGSLISGKLLYRWGLKPGLTKFAAIAALFNISYILLAKYSIKSLLMFYLLIALPQLGFGLSNGAYMAYIMKKVSDRKYAMTHYAINTSIMAFGMMLAGGISGFMQQWFGYQFFFSWIVLNGLFIAFLTYRLVNRNENK